MFNSMSIKELAEKINPFYVLLLVLVVASIFFALGRLSLLEEHHTPIKINYPNAISTRAVLGATLSPRQDLGESVTTQAGEVIGSKSGKKYYFPWCGTVSRIKPENQVHFASVDEARSAGYLPAANCKGLK